MSVGTVIAGAANITTIIYRITRVYLAGRDICVEWNSKERDNIKIAVNAIFMGFQAADMSCRLNPSLARPSIAMAANVGACVTDVALNQKKSIEKLFDLAAEARQAIEKGASRIGELRKLASSKEFLDLLGITLFNAGACTSRAAALKLVSDHAQEIGDVLVTVGSLIQGREDVMKAFDTALEKIKGLFDNSDPDPNRGNTRNAPPSSGQHGDVSVTNPQALSDEPLRNQPAFTREELLADDEQFKEWLRKQEGGMAYFCPVTGELMLHPVQCKKEANLFIDMRAFTQASIRIGEEDYKRGDFAPEAHPDKRSAILKSMGELQDRFASNMQETFEASLKLLYQKLDHWEELEEIPEEVSYICNTTHWLRCAATEKLVRRVVVPGNELRGEVDTNRPPICYEEAHINWLLNLDPPTAPLKWPANYPFIRENITPDCSLQRVVSRSLALAAESAKRIRGAISDTVRNSNPGSKKIALDGPSLVQAKPTGREVLMKEDEGFKKWLLSQEGGNAFFCPVATDTFLFHPVRCKKDPTLYVNQAILTMDEIPIRNRVYRPRDFEPKVHEDKRKIILQRAESKYEEYAGVLAKKSEPSQ